MRYLLLTFYTQASGKIDEAMTVANKIRTKDWQTVNVILDFKEQKVLKSMVNGQSATKDWDTIVGYYYQFYANTFERLFQDNGHELPTGEPKSTETTAG
jgi:hypothetical protein